MKKLWLFSFVILGFWVGLSTIIVQGQEEIPEDGPIYVVQPGDTLFSIALRFGVTVDNLVAVNDIVDINSLFVGDRLVIPGLESVRGTLTTREIVFGENVRSLSRQYNIDRVQLQRINRLVSPSELVVNDSLIIPLLDENPPSFQRVFLHPGETILELAVLSGTNPWKIVEKNQLKNTAAAMVGDVLMIPDSIGEGPSGLISLISNVEISPLAQGKTGKFSVISSSDLTLSGQLAEYNITFFPSDSNQYTALQGIDALHDPGVYPLHLSGKLPDGTRFAFVQGIYIAPVDYIFEYINVPPELIDPFVTQKESAEVLEIISPVTGSRYWEGVFQAPSPFPDCINSSYGNRRSYNGSPFTYYHGGTDFCGGTGVKIFAPASGIVIFAQQLEIRGNYTIIDHGWGIYTGYMHQSEILVQVGDFVEKGQTIGLVGNTGRSTGAHLHWELWAGKVLVDPVDWLVNQYP